MNLNADRVKQKALELGFHLVGIASVDNELVKEADRKSVV